MNISHAIIINVRFNGQTGIYRMNSGEGVSADRATAIKEFNAFCEKNKGLYAKLIEVNSDRSDGAVIAEVIGEAKNVD